MVMGAKPMGIDAQVSSRSVEVREPHIGPVDPPEQAVVFGMEALRHDRLGRAAGGRLPECGADARSAFQREKQEDRQCDLNRRPTGHAKP